ncbi:MAG: hypothetical protein QNL12_13065 [Acidimicrobiia bacterium]|nr:hypothetical protein [Acidimicrobiia bacterium]MDX2468242.1 hypothetical protein [Acidimicrobiia bacterium]
MSESIDNEVPTEPEWVPPALPVAASSNANQALLELWNEQPDDHHDVVVILTPASEDIEPMSLGMKSFEPIPYQPGMFRATMCGADLLALVDRPEVEAVVPDDEVGALET